MKKAFFILGICAVVSACGGNSASKGGSDSTAAANQTAKATNSDADTNATKTGTEGAGGSAGSGAGEKLLAANDCGTCHKVDTKVIGPSFQDIAKKYDASEANIDMLAKKVISGGSGNWGTMAMTPHAALAESDAKEIVKYILAQKK
ncbi:c-type cytochrome [Mucilaginibacter ginsenosidivorax]|uniref:C-type cytochrome n=1 Tax=Mucilaginibacter ginsenosidivorax TaxID=862126 RepID=A0A5B8VTI0_9SPHI|nr:c-type cytochrome [Mucilaginibacter ginsenosidivorax]QEC74907.1 c-type cytochrome [Mucilaginibacter ginsenosidivorax]